MKIRAIFSLAFFLGAVRCLNADTTVLTPPVGYFKLTALGASDSHLSIPLARRSVALARVQTVTSDSVALDLQGAEDGAYAPGANGVYYLQFASGYLSGLYYKIIDNKSGVYKLDLAGDDLSAHPMGNIATGENGDIVRICPYWTIAGIFGADEATLALAPRQNGSMHVYTEGDEVLVSDNNISGVENSLIPIGFVSGSGWRSRGGGVDLGSQTINPGAGFVVRRQGSASQEFIIVGDVPTRGYVTRMPAVAEGQIIDLCVGLVHPAPRSLSDSQLFSTDALSVLSASASYFYGSDFVFDYSDSRRGFALPAANQFYIVGSGWFKGLESADNYPLRPGLGYVLRIRGAHPVRYWVQKPASY